jgi:hypothetical protein
VVLKLTGDGGVKTSKIAIDLGWIALDHNFFGNSPDRREVEHSRFPLSN